MRWKKRESSPDEIIIQKGRAIFVQDKKMFSGVFIASVCKLQEFSFIISACTTPGEDNVIRLTGDNGTISQPNSTTKNMSCTWIISVPHGKLVMLKLHHYDLKNSTLQILDGLNSSSGVLESFSGKSEYEQTVFSSGCHLSVGLKTLQEKDVEFIIMFEAVKKCKAKVFL